MRNALARFNQVVFEDEAARDRARLRLLRAAQKHGVAPIGFISAQLQPQRRLPKGHVTFLLTDIERSTELLARLDDRYASLVSARATGACAAPSAQAGGHEVDARGDEFFAVFGDAPAALAAAVEVQRAMAAGPWPDGVDVRVRAGIHSGRPALTETGYVGLAVHAAARICYGAHGGQIVLSSATRAAIAGALADGVRLRSLGSWRFQGLRDPTSCSRSRRRARHSLPAAAGRRADLAREFAAQVGRCSSASSRRSPCRTLRSRSSSGARNSSSRRRESARSLAKAFRPTGVISTTWRRRSAGRGDAR